MIARCAKLGFAASQPVGLGLCNGGKTVYMLLTRIEGRDLEEILPHLSQKGQYALGRAAGRILKKIHSIPLEVKDFPDATKKEKKLRQLSLYEQSCVRIAGDEAVVRYVREGIDLLWREKPVYLHGDFHPGNLIYAPDGSLGVIDYNRWEVGDPYEEFYKLESFAAEVSLPYCVGQLDAYFDDEIPQTFWETLSVYVAHASLFSVKWAEKFGREEVDGMKKRYERALADCNGFRAVVPKWYSGEYRKRFL